ncbi:hypothetical protein [Acinetobacter sp.]|jgi:hypothetical protein|uniref:hypothetical protein n=1 Tax=Acinetobacter sp. TaxID=472 RepID=UPI003D0917AA
MLEFIGFMALCFVGYKVLKFFIVKNNHLNSFKYGMETRYFAVNELNIPTSYFNYVTLNKIEDIKRIALSLQKTLYPHATWPCLLAISIYMYFYDDLKKNNNIINELKIDPDLIKEVLQLDPNKLIEYFINSKKNYRLYTDEQVNQLIRESSKIYNKNISHDSSLFQRIDKYIETSEYMCWASHSLTSRGFEVCDMNNPQDSYFVSLEFINPEDQKSPITFVCNKAE